MNRALLEDIPLDAGHPQVSRASIFHFLSRHDLALYIPNLTSSCFLSDARMRRETLTARLLIVFLSVVFPFSGNFSSYDAICEIDILAGGRKYESLDGEDDLLDKQENLAFFPLPANGSFFLEISFTELSSISSFQRIAWFPLFLTLAASTRKTVQTIYRAIIVDQSIFGLSLGKNVLIRGAKKD